MFKFKWRRSLMSTSFFEYIGHSPFCWIIALFLLAVLVIRVVGVVVSVIRRVVQRIRRLPQQEQEQQEPERQQLRLIRGLIGRALERLGEELAWRFILWVTSMDQYKYGRGLRAFFTTDDYAEFVSRFGLSREQAEAELERFKLKGLLDEMRPSPGSPFEGKRVWRVPSMVLETLEHFPVQ
jgi:heme exporter protein D